MWEVNGNEILIGVEIYFSNFPVEKMMVVGYIVVERKQLIVMRM